MLHLFGCGCGEAAAPNVVLGMAVVITGTNFIGQTQFNNPERVATDSAVRWSTLSPMNTARSAHTATLLPNGKVLVAGRTGTSGYLASAELYDPAAQGRN